MNSRNISRLYFNLLYDAKNKVEIFLQVIIHCSNHSAFVVSNSVLYLLIYEIIVFNIRLIFFFLNQRNFFVPLNYELFDFISINHLFFINEWIIYN